MVTAKSKSSSVSKVSLSSSMNEGIPRKGLGVWMTAFFLIAQMAGAGFLSLPRAMADAGWLGLGMILIFCFSVGFVAIRLGRCWTTIEMKHPELKQAVRQPYMEIAEKSLGMLGRRLALFCLMFTTVGSGIVFLILIAQMLNSLIPGVSTCQWIVIVSVLVTPITWAGTPKDFWQASVFATISTVICIIIIIAKTFLDYGGNLDEVSYPNPTIASFALGFGAILFAFGGASIFPTIQNDMAERDMFWKSIIITFVAILVMYLPVALSGYILIGDDVNSNILLSLEYDTILMVAIILEIFNLLGTFIIIFNPISQTLEDIFNMPSDFGWHRIYTRTGMMLFQMIIGLAIPNFGLILNLIGGSTIMCLSFLFPPLMYMKLYDSKVYREFMPWSIDSWERIFLWEIIIVGVIGGIASTLSALAALLSPGSFSNSCFVSFSG